MRPVNPRAQTALNQRKHIPAHIEQAMNQHLQQNLPTHLREYASGQRGYVPQHIERQIGQAMQKNMPAHLQQYSGAYLQQRVVQPSTARPTIQTSAGVTPHAPRPDKLRRDHSMFGNQYTVDPNTLTGPANQPSGQSGTPQYEQPAQPQYQQPVQPAQPYVPDGPPPQHPRGGNYDFIMNPSTPEPPKQSKLPGSNSSFPIKIALMAGFLVIALIAFSFLRGLLSGGGGNFKPYLSIAQDQYAMVQLTKTAIQGQNLNSKNQNLAATAQLSLTTAQSDTVAYLKQNKQKVDPKQLVLKVKAETNQRLTAAAAATTYNQTFQEIMREQLNDYISHLMQAGSTVSGQVGRELLRDQLEQAQLLMTQLEEASSDTIN